MMTTLAMLQSKASQLEAAVRTTYYVHGDPAKDVNPSNGERKGPTSSRTRQNRGVYVLAPCAGVRARQLSQRESEEDIDNGDTNEAVAANSTGQ